MKYNRISQNFIGRYFCAVLALGMLLSGCGGKTSDPGEAKASKQEVSVAKKLSGYSATSDATLLACIQGKVDVILESHNMTVEDCDGNYALYSFDGQRLLDLGPECPSIKSSYKGNNDDPATGYVTDLHYLIMEQDGKKGVVSVDGEVIIPCQSDYVDLCGDWCAWSDSEQNVTLTNLTTGKVLFQGIPSERVCLMDYYGGIYTAGYFEGNNKVANTIYFDKDGNEEDWTALQTIIENKSAPGLREFTDDYRKYWEKVDGVGTRCGLRANDGTVLTEAHYKNINAKWDWNGYVAFWGDEGPGIMDNDGNVVIPERAHEKLVLCDLRNGGRGALQTQKVFAFHNVDCEELHLVNIEKGTEAVVPAESVEFYGDLAAVREPGSEEWTYVDTDGNRMDISDLDTSFQVYATMNGSYLTGYSDGDEFLMDLSGRKLFTANGSIKIMPDGYVFFRVEDEAENTYTLVYKV